VMKWANASDSLQKQGSNKRAVIWYRGFLSQ